MPFVLGKTKDHATYIRESVLAKPHRIRRAGIYLLLGVGDCGERGRESQDESNGAQFVHDVALQFEYRSNNDWNRNLFHSDTIASPVSTTSQSPGIRPILIQ